jgi:ribosomal protein S18 acetylase RimI-like enzyme
MQKLSFLKAKLQDIETLTELINSAYRGELSKSGWTTEADLLDGLRTDGTDLQRLITSDDSLILTCRNCEVLIGSIHLQKIDQQVEIGMFAVNPLLQGSGVGKQLLQEAEMTALQIWTFRKFVMAVITSRHELISFYERRGYRRTGTIKAFPVNPSLWIPKVTDLQLELLEKSLSS